MKKAQKHNLSDDPSGIDRRSYLKYVVGGAAAAIIAGGGYYAWELTRPKPKPIVKASFMAGSWWAEWWDNNWDAFFEAKPEYENFDLSRTYAGGLEYRDVLATRVGAGEPPDIFHTWNGLRDHEWLVGEEVSIPLPYAQRGWADVFLGGMENMLIATSTYNGNTHLFPYSYNARMMLINTAIFDEAGIEIPEDGQWTYDEFDDVCAELKASGLVDAPMGLQNRETWMPSTMFGHDMEEFLGPEDTMKLWHSWLPGTTDYLEWTDPRVVEAFNIVPNWNRKGYFLPGMNDTVSTDLFGALNTKKCAVMLVAHCWSGDEFKQNLEPVHEDMLYVPWPCLPEHKNRGSNIIIWGDGLEISGQSTDEVVELGLDYMEWISREDSFWSKIESFGGFSPYAMAWENIEKYYSPYDQELLKPFFDRWAANKVYPVLDLELNERVNDANYRAIMDVYSLARDAELALAEIEAESQSSRESA